MSVVTETHVLVKGSPDQVLEKVTHILHEDGTNSAITGKEKETIQASYEEMSSRALRVLMVAVRTYESVPDTETAAEHDLTYVGLIAMIDPPREEARLAVQNARDA